MENVKHKDFNVELTGVDSKVCCDIFALAMPADTAMPTKLPLTSSSLVGIVASAMPPPVFLLQPLENFGICQVLVYDFHQELFMCFC